MNIIDLKKVDQFETLEDWSAAYDEMRRTCDHGGYSLIVHRRYLNGSIRYYEQCPKCWKSKPVKKEIALEICETHTAWKDRSEVFRKASRYFQNKNSTKTGKEKYREYLKSPIWREKRAKVLRRCKHLCEGCRTNAAMEVHHLTYKHIYDEMLFELVGLCEDCHRKIHKK